MNSDNLKPTAYSKVKKIPVTRQAFADFFKENDRLIEVTDGIPEDAELVRIDYSSKRDIYYFIIESEQFEVVKEGDKIPETDVQFKSHHKSVFEEEEDEDDEWDWEPHDTDPIDIPDPSPRDPFEPDYPDRKFPRWYVQDGNNNFTLEIEEDDDTLVEKTVEL